MIRVFMMLKILQKFQIYVRKDKLKIGDFKNAEEKIKNFSQNLFPKTNNEEKKERKNLIRAILYAIRFVKENKTNILKKLLTKT